IVAAAGRVDDVAHRDLVADDERRLLRAREEPLERGGITERRFVEALPAGKALLAVRVRGRRAIRVERLPLELADADVAEVVVDEMRHLAVAERDVGGLQRAREWRDCCELDR